MDRFLLLGCVFFLVGTVSCYDCSTPTIASGQILAGKGCVCLNSSNAWVKCGMADALIGLAGFQPSRTAMCHQGLGVVMQFMYGFNLTWNRYQRSTDFYIMSGPVSGQCTVIRISTGTTVTGVAPATFTGSLDIIADLGDSCIINSITDAGVGAYSASFSNCVPVLGNSNDQRWRNAKVLAGSSDQAGLTSVYNGTEPLGTCNWDSCISGLGLGSEECVRYDNNSLNRVNVTAEIMEYVADITSPHCECINITDYIVITWDGVSMNCGSDMVCINSTLSSSLEKYTVMAAGYDSCNGSLEISNGRLLTCIGELEEVMTNPKTVEVMLFLDRNHSFVRCDNGSECVDVMKRDMLDYREEIIAEKQAALQELKTCDEELSKAEEVITVRESDVGKLDRSWKWGAIYLFAGLNVLVYTILGVSLVKEKTFSANSNNFEMFAH